MTDSTLGASLREASRDIRNQFLDRIYQKKLECRQLISKKESTMGFILNILKDTKTEEPWLTKYMI